MMLRGGRALHFIAQRRWSSVPTDLKEMRRRKRMMWKPWKFGYQVAARASPIHWDVGTWLVSMGSVFQLLGFTMTDMISLRLLSMGSAACWMTFYLRQLHLAPSLRVPLYWVSTFFCVHLSMVTIHILKNQERDLAFTEEELDVFDEHFLSTGMKPREYKQLLDEAMWIDVPPGGVILEEGRPVTHLFIISKGRVKTTKNGVSLQALSSYPGARDSRPAGDAGAWVGDVAWLEHIGGKNMLTLTDNAELLANADRHTQDTGLTLGKRDDSEVGQVGAPLRTFLSKPVASADVRRDKELEPPSAPPRVRDRVNPTLEPPVEYQLGRSRALYTYRAKSPTRCLVFHHKKLNAMLANNPQIRSAFQAAVTNAVVGKIVNLSDQTALQQYRESLRALLFDGSITPAEKRFLREYRVRHAITYADHAKALSRLGWSENEFNDGTKTTLDKSTAARIEAKIKRTMSQNEGGAGAADVAQVAEQAQ